LEDVGIDGNRILKRVVKKWDLAQGRNKKQAVMNMVMTLL
jgi:hypothetical protein